MADSLGDRMKGNYEKRFEYKLVRRLPVIVRLDGRSFHSIKCEKPFDVRMSQCMEDTTKYLLEEMQGAKCAYTQSDEISVCLVDYDTISTQAWFDYDLQKLVSISAALASVHFSNINPFQSAAQFDARAFNIPLDEVANYFVWRQKDWIRNSVEALAQSHFSAKQLMNKGQPEMHDMLHEKGVNWADLPSRFKNGVYLFRSDVGIVSRDDVIFTEDRGIVEAFLQRQD